MNQFGESEGFQFQFHDKWNLFKQVCGYLSQFINTTIFKFRCSQCLYLLTSFKLSYLKTRNRRAKKIRFECKRLISVLFSSSFDMKINQKIVVVFGHSLHSRCEYYDVFLQMRYWIRDNSRLISQAQHDEIFLIIEKREIQDMNNKYLSVVHIHYWWKKRYIKIIYISNDSWINIKYILKNHFLVFQFCSIFSILI